MLRYAEESQPGILVQAEPANTAKKAPVEPQVKNPGPRTVCIQNLNLSPTKFHLKLNEDSFCLCSDQTFLGSIFFIALFSISYYIKLDVQKVKNTSLLSPHLQLKCFRLSNKLKY